MMQVKLSLVLAMTLVSCLILDSCWAGNVGRQRRVQTSATTTGPAPPALIGLSPLFYSTFDSNDEYIETPFGRPHMQHAAQQQQPQPQQQHPKHLSSNIYAEKQVADNDAGRSAGAVDVDYANLVASSELTPAQLQQLLLFNTPAMAAQQQYRYFNPSGSQDQEPRFFHMHMKNLYNKPDFMWPNNSAPQVERNTTNVNINQNNVTLITPAPAAAAGTRILGTELLRSPQFMPMQYFQTRQGPDAGQDAGQRLPYDLLDLNAAGLYGGGLTLTNNVAGLNGFTGGLGGINGLNGLNGLGALGGLNGLGGLGGAGVPLVPVTLGNNAVGYVPLNLRMFRQLQAAMPIRESEEEATAEATETVEPEPESTDATEEGADKLSGSRFQMFGQRLRQRPVATATVNDGGFPMRNPLMAFAKNIRRVQYL